MNKTIYVVDDDPIIRILVSDYLEARGYKVSSFQGPRECIESLFHGRPDLIFIDMQMPEMNGAELLQVIRHTPELALNLSRSAATARVSAIRPGRPTTSPKQSMLTLWESVTFDYRTIETFLLAADPIHHHII